MTTVAILAVPTNGGRVSYRAVAGEKRSSGRTAGEALDALTAQLGEEEGGTLVVVQNRRPDRFFNAEQQRRLSELMARWRAARDAGQTLPAQEQAELDALADAELHASAARTAALVQEIA